MFWGHHMGLGGWSLLINAILWIGLIALGVWLLARLFSGSGGSRSDEGNSQTGQWAERGERQETPLEILQKRYARGEISKEEYETVRHDLSS